MNFIYFVLIIIVILLLPLFAHIYRQFGRRYFPCRSNGIGWHPELKITDNGNLATCEKCGVRWELYKFSSIAGNGDTLDVFYRIEE